MTVIQRLGNLKSVWTVLNPVLLVGQEVYEIDDVTGEQRIKLGDGTTDYVTLPYIVNPSAGPADGSITTAKIANNAVTADKIDATIASTAALDAEATARATADALKANLTDPRFTDDRDPIDGSVTIAKFDATGTPDATTFLRGDDTWSAGLSVASISYHHSQTTPSNVWTISHGLAFVPNWRVVDSGGDLAIGSIADTAGQTVITFSASFSGEAYGS